MAATSVAVEMLKLLLLWVGLWMGLDVHSLLLLFIECFLLLI